MLGTSISFQNLLKEGFRHYSGLEEAMLKNIDACREISKITRTSLGPMGMKKIIVTHLGRVYVTDDAATIVEELEVHHPAASMLKNSAKMQEQECGDGTNFVLILGGELLNQAETLLKIGLHPNQILLGYEKAMNLCLNSLDSLACLTIKNIRNREEILPCVKSVIGTKQYGLENVLAPLVYDACVYALPTITENFNVDNVRVVKILGGSINDSQIVHGLVLTRGSETSVTHVVKAKVVVYNQDLEIDSGETKGTVVIKNASELLNYTIGEENRMEKLIKEIVDSGVNVVIVGGSISDMAIHFFDKYKVMCIKVLSKFELRRLAKSLGAALVSRKAAPTKEEIGSCDEVTVCEVAGEKIMKFANEKEECKIGTIIIRGATSQFMDDIERAINDGVNAVKNITKNPKFVAGAGACEIHLAHLLIQQAKKETGLDQYSMRKFAEALEQIPCTLVENAGLRPENLIAELYAETAKNKLSGVSIEDGKIKEACVYDSLEVKKWGIKFACETVLTLLSIDQIIVAKPSGGPNPNAAPKQKMDDD